MSTAKEIQDAATRVTLRRAARAVMAKDFKKAIEILEAGGFGQVDKKVKTQGEES